METPIVITTRSGCILSIHDRFGTLDFIEVNLDYKPFAEEILSSSESKPSSLMVASILTSQIDLFSSPSQLYWVSTDDDLHPTDVLVVGFPPEKYQAAARIYLGRNLGWPEGTGFEFESKPPNSSI